MKIIFYFMKIISSEYKKILATVIMSTCIGFFLLATLNYFDKRDSTFESFTMDVVVEDENRYLDLLMKQILTRDDFKKILSFNITSKNDAMTRFKNETTPCYIIIPNGFTESVLNGENTPVIFVGNKDFSIQYSIAETVLKSGIAFLSSSQSGIYSTIDFAVENNISDEIINDKIIMGINLEFARALLSYKDYFQIQKLFITGNVPLRTNYISSFIIFFIIINSISLYDVVNKIFCDSIRSRFLLAGIKSTKYILLIFISIFLFLLCLCLPFAFLFGAKIIFIALSVSAINLFSSVFFRNSTSSSVFIFSTAIFMLFISGGLIPKGLLPDFINRVSFISINHYINLPTFSFNFLLYSLIISTISIGLVNFFKTRS